MMNEIEANHAAAVEKVRQKVRQKARAKKCRETYRSICAAEEPTCLDCIDSPPKPWMAKGRDGKFYPTDSAVCGLGHRIIATGGTCDCWHLKEKP